MADLDSQMRALGVALADREPPRPEELTRRAQRVRRRRRGTRAVAVLLAVGLVVGAVVVVRAGDPASRVEAPPASSASDRSTVLVIDAGTDPYVTLHDLDAGTSSEVALQGRIPGDFTNTLVATDGWIAYHTTDGVRAVRADGSGRPVSLGGRGWTLRPSARPGWVWLVRPVITTGPAGQIVREVRIEGSESRPTSSRLPGTSRAIAGVPGGLLVSVGSGHAAWDARTGEIGPVIVDGAPGFIDTRDAQLAVGTSCGDGGCDAVSVYDFGDGTTRRFAAPPGTTGWISTDGQGSRDAFSRDGRYLAVRAIVDEVRSPQRVPTRTEVYVIDVRTGTTMPVPDSTSDYPYSRTAWSARGYWLFHETGLGTLGAFRPSDGATRAFPEPCCGVALLSLSRSSVLG